MRFERLHRRPPAPLAYVWQWFCELDAARAPREPIRFVDMQAWAAMTGTAPTVGEVALIRRLDELALADPASWERTNGG